MTVTAPTEPRRDAKAGFCARCRNGQHVLCASPPDRCGCPYRDHPGRPTTAAVPSTTGDRTPVTKTPAAGNGATPTKLREPVWKLVREEPPAPPRKPKRLTVVERARPFIEEVVEQGNRDWWRFAVCPGTQGASQVRARIAKAYPEFEFKAVKLAEAGQSALYGRWLGQESGPTGGGGEPTAASGSAASIVARAPSSSRGPADTSEEE